MSWILHENPTEHEINLSNNNENNMTTNIYFKQKIK
jgi:hypothetical protein